MKRALILCKGCSIVYTPPYSVERMILRLMVAPAVRGVRCPYRMAETLTLAQLQSLICKQR